jgi:hypothetical protein
MLLPRTHAWSSAQKRLIVGAVVCTLIGASFLVYHFERHHRLPDDSILFGTWEMVTPHGMDSTDWMALKPDHTVVWSSFSVADYKIDWEGVWYAGGNYIYMGGEAKPAGIWEIIDVGPDKLRLRIAKQDYVFKRVAAVPPEASNQAMVDLSVRACRREQSRLEATGKPST